MITYQQQFDNDLWNNFKATAFLNGLLIKDAVPQALAEFVENHKPESVHLNEQIIQDTTRNLLVFVYEEELKNIVAGLLDAKKRNAPTQFINGLKKQALDILKKHPSVTKEIAEEVVQAFKQVR